MTKQITINELIPLLKPGYVAMDATGEWYWYRKQPKQGLTRSAWAIDPTMDPKSDFQALSVAFNIAKSDVEWDKSLIKVGNK